MSAGQSNVRHPGVIDGIEFYGICDLTLDELHEELAYMFEQNAHEAAAFYLEDV